MANYRTQENYQRTSKKTMSKTTIMQPNITADISQLSELVDQLMELSLSDDSHDRNDAINICQQICDLSVEISAQLTH